METPEPLISEEEFADSPLLRETARRLNFVFHSAAEMSAPKARRFMEAWMKSLASPRRITRSRLEQPN